MLDPAVYSELQKFDNPSEELACSAPLVTHVFLWPVVCVVESFFDFSIFETLGYVLVTIQSG